MRVPDAEPRPIRVVIADDSDVIRAGLLALLRTSPDIEVVGEATNGEEAILLAEELRPDVALLDVRMPRRDGVSCAEQLAGFCRVLMLTFSDEPDTIDEAVRVGAAGYLIHGHFDARDLVGNVQRVARGEGVFSPQALDVLRQNRGAPSHTPVDPRQYGLTAREIEIMHHVAAGLSNGEIAGVCFLSEKTVKNHINHIFTKLGVTTRAKAITLWLNGGE